MKTLKHSPAIFILVPLLTQCAQTQRAEQDNSMELQGSWNLVEYIPHDQGKTEWESYGDSILYQKHLTTDHFTWIKYDTKNERLMGMGGGSYSIQTGQYVENIEFFHPPGSSENGQAIPFDYELSGKTWYHTGFAKEMEINMETGEIEVVDSSKIEEKWVRSDLTPSAEAGLIGTWELVSHLDPDQGVFIEYPDFADYIKLITPTHFAWIYFNGEGDEIYASGSGRYQYKNGKYSETIDMIYPSNNGQIGETIVFSTEINGAEWKHSGYLPNLSIDTTNGNIVKDSILIDELWALHSDQEE